MLSGFADVRWINEQMQRSRRALLHRRAASEKNLYYRKKRFYKVSASLVFVLWLVVFLLNLLISKGNGFRGKFLSFFPALMILSRLSRSLVDLFACFVAFVDPYSDVVIQNFPHLYSFLSFLPISFLCLLIKKFL